MKKPAKKSKSSKKTKKPAVKKTAAGNAFKKNALELEQAALEAYPPQALIINGSKDFIVRGCDGDNEYIWIAMHILYKGKEVYRLKEVYPGLEASKTSLRVAKEAKDLVFPGRFDSLSDLLIELEDQLFADFEESDEDEGCTDEEADEFEDAMATAEPPEELEAHEPHPVASAATVRP